MKKTHTRPQRVWMVAAIAGLSITAGIGLCQIQPVGSKAGLIQFDAINELNMEELCTNTVVFTRYWVCQDYYALSVAWCEPHGRGLMYVWRTLVILSDETGIRMAHEWYHDWVPVNTTYPKPLGERGPFWVFSGGIPRLAEMRFAEAEALARRVRAGDLGPPEDAYQRRARVVDRTVPQGADDGKRKLARLKAHLKGNRIETMELFSEQQELLCRTKYEYDGDGNASLLTRLVADLPVRREKLAANMEEPANLMNMSVQLKKTGGVPGTIDHVHHKGGRTCTVAYRDVSIGDTVLRLPVQVEVRVSDDKRLLRSSRLMNFKRVDLDKAGVWEAARAFAHLSPEDRAYGRLVGKYIEWKPKLGPMRVDPNDLAFVERLIAKYPVRPDVPAPPRRSVPQDRTQSRPTTTADRKQILTTLQEKSQVRRRERARWEEQMAKWQEQVARTPKPERMEIEPNDARAIRRLCGYYGPTSLTEEQRKLLHEWGWYRSETRFRNPDLYQKLRHILSYHRAPRLPEDRPPEMDPDDRTMIRQLQVYYERLAEQQDRGLGGRLKAVHALTRLDRMLEDYDAFEGHTLRYLKMLQQAGSAGRPGRHGHGGRV